MLSLLSLTYKMGLLNPTGKALKRKAKKAPKKNKAKVVKKKDKE